MLAKPAAPPEEPLYEVWVVSPAERQVYVYESRDKVRIIAGTAELNTPLLPGWRMQLPTLFRTPAP